MMILQCNKSDKEFINAVRSTFHVESEIEENCFTGLETINLIISSSSLLIQTLDFFIMQIRETRKEKREKKEKEEKENQNNNRFIVTRSGKYSIEGLSKEQFLRIVDELKVENND